MNTKECFQVRHDRILPIPYIHDHVPILQQHYITFAGEKKKHFYIIQESINISTAKINIKQRQLLQSVCKTYGSVFLFILKQWMGRCSHTLYIQTVPSVLSSRTRLFPVGSRGRLKVELEARLIFSSVCSIGRSGTSWFRRSLRQQMEATSGSNAIKRLSGRPGSQRPAW